LRESIYAIASALNAASLDEPARAVLNRIAAGAAAAPSLTSEGRLVLRGSAATLLTALARDAVRLFGSETGRIRQCESANCSIFFLDTSRSGRRRWCSMAACGNKAKVAALRSRARAQQ
jgi:predicted RNA-binding Zn ribbon-like protein